MLETIAAWLDVLWIRAITIVLGSVLAAHAVELIFAKVVVALTLRTESKVDDQIAQVLRRPIYFSVILLGLAWAAATVQFSSVGEAFFENVLVTLTVVLWTTAFLRMGSLVFQALAARSTEKSLVQPRTQPIFDIFSKLTVMALAAYAVLLIWNINVGAWLASAGIAGIALGFAAKDTLANLFAGIFIIADAPYKVGDFIVLDGNLRGRVTAIGFRSTRLLTLDDIEITIPNGILGNSQIINESGGPYRKARVAITVEAAYGSDVEKVREALLACVEGTPHVVSEPAPVVRFKEFGASGLVHQLHVWIDRPSRREIVVDALNRRAYNAFAAADIEIPYSKHDVYIKQFSGSLAA